MEIGATSRMHTARKGTGKRQKGTDSFSCTRRPQRALRGRALGQNRSLKSVSTLTQEKPSYSSNRPDTAICLAMADMLFPCPLESGVPNHAMTKSLDGET